MRLPLIKISLLTIFCLFYSNFVFADELLKNVTIKTDKVLTGRVIIEGKVVVEKSAVLYIKPGTQIFFQNLDSDGDGISETSLWIYGNIIAKGDKNNKILFTSYEKEKRWGDWKEIQINHVKGFIFEYVDLQYSEYGLHIHFSEGEIKNSIFRYNNDCTRLGNSKILFKNNLFEKNSGKALNFTNCNIVFEENVVRDNREGVFVFEKTGNVNIRNNNIYNNFKNIKTGDFFKEQLILGENYIYPPNNIEGNVKVTGLKEPIYGILPDEKSSYISFAIETNGFVDGSAIISEEKLYFPSFDGNIYEYDLKKHFLRKFNVGDFIDAVPVVFKDKLFYQNWSGEIGYFDLTSGSKKVITHFDNTLKDDHRNPSPVKTDDKIIFLSPGGSLVVVDIIELKQIFRTKLDCEFRASPLIKDNFLYINSTNGDVYKLSLDNFNVTKNSLDDSFYATPILFENSIVLTGKEGKIFFLDDNLNLKKLIDLKSSFRYQSPLAYKDSLFFFSLDGKIYQVKKNFEIFLKKEIKDIFTATPITYKDFLVIPSFYGNLYFYREDKLFMVSNLGELQFSPISFGDIIIVGSRANRVYGIKIW